MIAVWINSSSAPFLDDIMLRLKPYETRSRRMLHRLLGQRVILAESKNGQRLARCSVVIRSEIAVRSWEEWDALRPLHRVPAGSQFDWKPGTRVKYLYELSNLRRLRPFRIPAGTPHGYTYEEFTKERRTTR